jgi:hypothetical protein
MKNNRRLKIVKRGLLLGANAVEAGNGIEGLEAIKTHQPALVLTDILIRL